MVLTMYRTLTLAIHTESSLAVLVEVLKCLIVLIQATTFSRLRTGFVGPLVTFVRRLVHHKGAFGCICILNLVLTTIDWQTLRFRCPL